MPLLAINHHYYRELKTGRGIYPTTPLMLADELQKLRESGWRVGNEADIQKFLAGNLEDDDKVAILTFDDGLAEQMDALTQLKSMEAIAIFYVPTAPIVEGFVLDVHKLQLIRAHVEDQEFAAELDKKFVFSKQEFNDELLTIQYRYDNELGRRIKYFINFMLQEDVRAEWLSEYFVTLFGDEKAVANSLYMSNEDLLKLSNQRLLGSHAHQHLPLATIDLEQMRHELGYSRHLIQKITTISPVGISYPYGGKSAVGHQVFDSAISCGYTYGFTMERGINGQREQKTPMALKRIDVNDLDYWLNGEINV